VLVLRLSLPRHPTYTATRFRTDATLRTGLRSACRYCLAGGGLPPAYAPAVRSDRDTGCCAGCTFLPPRTAHALRLPRVSLLRNYTAFTSVSPPGSPPAALTYPAPAFTPLHCGFIPYLLPFAYRALRLLWTALHTPAPSAFSRSVFVAFYRAVAERRAFLWNWFTLTYLFAYYTYMTFMHGFTLPLDAHLDLYRAAPCFYYWRGRDTAVTRTTELQILLPAFAYLTATFYRILLLRTVHFTARLRCSTVRSTTHTRVAAYVLGGFWTLPRRCTLVTRLCHTALHTTPGLPTALPVRTHLCHPRNGTQVDYTFSTRLGLSTSLPFLYRCVLQL